MVFSSHERNFFCCCHFLSRAEGVGNDWEPHEMLPSWPREEWSSFLLLSRPALEIQGCMLTLASQYFIRVLFFWDDTRKSVAHLRFC